MPTIAEIIAWKFNSQSGMMTQDGVITEFPGGIPSQADQDLWRNEYIAKFGDVSIWEIHNNRREAYPNIGDQLDSLYHAGVFPEDMTAKIKAIKDKYPKE